MNNMLNFNENEFQVHMSTSLGLFLLVIVIEILMPFFVFLLAHGFEGDNDKINLSIN